jgi:hypothetical protein
MDDKLRAPKFRVIAKTPDGTSSTLMMNLSATVAEGLVASLTERFPDTKFVAEPDVERLSR